MSDGFVARQQIGERKETRLHHSVDSTTQPRLLRNLIGIDREYSQLFVQDLLLQFHRQTMPDVGRKVGAVQQECCVFGRCSQHIEAMQELKLMAGNEVCFLDQVGRADRRTAESKVRNGYGAGLL